MEKEISNPESQAKNPLEKISAFPQFNNEGERYRFLAKELRASMAKKAEGNNDYLKAADIYLRMGDRVKAEELISKQVETTTDLFTKAKCLNRLGKGVEARELYIEFIRQETPKAKKGQSSKDSYGNVRWIENPTGNWEKIAEAYEAQGDHVSSRRAYGVTLDLAISKNDWRTAALVSKKMGNEKEAKAYLERVASEESKKIDKAKALEQAGKMDDARKAYEECLGDVLDNYDSDLRLEAYEGLHRIHTGISVDEENDVLSVPVMEQKIEVFTNEKKVSFAGIVRSYNENFHNPDLIPKTEMVETKTVVSHLKKIAMAADSTRSPVLLIGPTGTGKSSLVSYYSKLMNKECLMANMNGQTDITHLVGKYEVKDGATVWVDGPLPASMRHGYHIVLEEINTALPDVLVRLNNLLDSNNALVLIERDNEMVRPHPDFRFFATMNPAGEYAGAKELNPAFKGRFSNVLYVDFLPADEELDILRKYAPNVAVQTLKRMQTIAHSLRSSYLGGSFDTLFSMRELISWAANTEKYKDHFTLRELGELAFINKIESDTSRKAAIDVFNVQGIK